VPASGKKYKAVIFDLDGVLVDSEPLHLRSVEILLARRGIRLTPEQAAQQTGITIHKFMEKIVNEWGYPGPKEGEDWVAEKRVIFREIAKSELRTVAGVEDLLRALRGKTRLGLASSSPRQYIDWCVERFGWKETFDAICTVEDVRRPKPDPEMYRLIAARLGAADGPALAFEDSPAGVESAVAAGLDCAGVATSLAPETLVASGACWVIRDFTDRETLDPLLRETLGRPLAALSGEPEAQPTEEEKSATP